MESLKLTAIDIIMPFNGFILVCVSLILCLGLAAGAQVTNVTMSTADAFLVAGAVNYQDGADLRGLNFGGAGTLAIAPATASKGESLSVVKFNLQKSIADFNAAFGSNNWFISGLTLDLTSNYGQGGVQPNNPIFNIISVGKFVIEWLSNDDWVEGSGSPSVPTIDGVAFNDLASLLDSPHFPLCTNNYVPPGVNVHVLWPVPLEPHLVDDVMRGGEVSFYFYAADERVGYLFNSHNYGRGNEPLIRVVASPFLRILSVTVANGVFQLKGIGNSGAIYQLQSTVNLSAVNWKVIGTATADASGVIFFEDAGFASESRCFYRLSQ